MYLRKKFLLPLLLLFVLALALSSCQNAQKPANTENTQAAAKASATTTAKATAPAPSADAGDKSDDSATPDTGFQEVDAPLDKIIFPPEAPANFAPAERPHSTLGQDDATLTMYEWCDYSYPNCISFNSDVLPELRQKYVDTGKLRIVHKEFPVAGGDPAVVASMGAQCAAEQEKYQEMADWLYQNTDAWSQQTDIQAIKDAIKKGAAEVGLDTDAFNACIDNEDSLEVIKQDYYDGRELEFRELPGFVIGGHLVNQGASANELSTIIDALLQKQETGSLPDTVITVTPSPTPDTDFEEESVASLGSPDAPVTIIEFSDFQCPYCERFYSQTFEQLKTNYIDTGKVRFVFKDFPLSFHEKAMPAALAAECAGEQGKYWEMHDKLFGEQQRWVKSDKPNDVFKEFAKELGVDTDKFNECLDSQKYLAEIREDQQEGLAAGVQGTPAFFINGQFLSGAQPYQVFQQVIDQILAEK